MKAQIAQMIVKAVLLVKYALMVKYPSHFVLLAITATTLASHGRVKQVIDVPKAQMIKSHVSLALTRVKPYNHHV